jgi:hypothetical protein
LREHLRQLSLHAGQMFWLLDQVLEKMEGLAEGVVVYSDPLKFKMRSDSSRLTAIPSFC